MKAGDAAPRSILDKPFDELTEEEISQLTREDCRRYLKEKGMRRPSWNKSQAIQQVLSLKNLFDSKPDSGDAYQEPAKPSHIDSLKEISTSGVEVKKAAPPVFKEIPIPAINEQKHSVNGGHLAFPGTREFRPPVAVKKQFFRDDRSSVCPRSAGPTNETGQLTIFYSGSVNVYDTVPADKVRAIMHLAGNPNFFPQIPPAGAAAIRRLPSTFPIGWVKPGYASEPLAAITPSLQTEVPKTRKASVQRFLEKRKDRGRLKGMHGQKKGPPSSFMEVVFNQEVKGLKSEQTLSASGMCATTRSRPPHTPSRCSSTEN